MDFKLTPEQEALKKEFEEFFEAEMKNAPEDWVWGLDGMYNDIGWPFNVYMAKRLAEKGWLVRPWPEEYGGCNAPMMEQLIFSDVLGYYCAPGVDPLGIGMIGPTLLAIGNEEQKKEHLPPISKAERFWCQGWSEPNAGSDLASLTTKAVQDGDDWILNGQKCWNTGAHRADWCFTLARTNPEEKRGKGLTFFLLDMKSPGVSVVPIEGMDGSKHFNEIYFDDVRVPSRNIIGEVNGGWIVTQSTMNFERSSVGVMSGASRGLNELVQYCKETTLKGKPLSENPHVRHRLAQIAIDIDAGRAMSYRCGWLQEKGDIMAAASASCGAKVYSTELWQRMAYVGVETMGLYGSVTIGSKWAVLKGQFENLVQVTPGYKLGGGTSEIMRSIIAWVGLGLPRIK